MQNPGSQLLQKTAFSPRTAKFVFIALLTFAIALTSLSVQAAPSKAIRYSSSLEQIAWSPDSRQLTKDRNVSIFDPTWQP